MNEKVEIPKIDGDFESKSIISIDQLGSSEVNQVMIESAAMERATRKRGRIDLLSDKVVADLFYEPSTRTFMSFEAAAIRLGAGTIEAQGVEYSSISKGETLEDTIRTVECYADIITLRHQQVGAAAVAASVSKKPIINGGDGVGEHPTQALLDLFTIQKESDRPPEDLTVTMLGDLKNGRTVHSLAKLLSMYGSRINYVSPDDLGMPKELEEVLHKRGVEQKSTDNLEEVLSETDVLYVTRIQKERFASPEEYMKHKDAYVIDKETMARAPKDMILMHPLPRVGEISLEVDNDPRAVYFKQVENGMFVRMALLALVAGRSIAKSSIYYDQQVDGQLTLH